MRTFGLHNFLYLGLIFCGALSVVMGRKNFLGSKSIDGADAAATL